MAGFKRATREQTYLRMAIDGPPGSGKTFTGLRLANGLRHHLDLRGPLAVIDSERGTARKYVGEQPDDDLPPWEFEVCELQSFSPNRYTEAIEEAARMGCSVLFVDSLSHAWTGKDGALELKDKQAQQKGNNDFTAWRNVTPLHNDMVEAILRAPMHVIVTMRSKVEYVLETNENGKQVPRRIGVAPVQRAGMEYEFDLYASMDWSHFLTVSKSRCRAVADAIAPSPTAHWIRPVANWLTSGAAVSQERPKFVRQRATAQQVEDVLELSILCGLSREQLTAETFKRFAVDVLGDLLPEQAGEMIERLRARAPQQPQPEPTATPEPPSPPALTGYSVSAKANLATPEQVERFARLRQHYLDAGMAAEDWQAIFHRRDVPGPADLTQTAAEELLGKLRAQLELQEMGATAEASGAAKGGDAAA